MNDGGWSGQPLHPDVCAQGAPAGADAGPHSPRALHLVAILFGNVAIAAGVLLLPVIVLCGLWAERTAPAVRHRPSATQSATPGTTPATAVPGVTAASPVGTAPLRGPLL